jgi:DNA-binding IclR family transcriptional regulator
MDRWLAILEAFENQDTWGVRELAAHAGLAPSVVHRVLHDMDALGLVSSGARKGQFRVGPELARLAVLVSDRLDVRRMARPALEEAARLIDETVILALYSPTRQQFWAVDAAEPEHPIRYIWESLRGWSDLHLGASGLGILAFLPEPDRERVIGTRPDVERHRLRERLAETRARGYAATHGDRFPGAVGVAAPVRDASGTIVGDIIAGWPDNRTSADKERLVAQAVIAAATTLSKDLGYRPPGRDPSW